ncbi:MAG: hypothetical protein ACKV2Q_13155 [Planctomycetaceae bacterium]
MPIKFRCDHCRQFLGISHTKSGMLVDCPTCGRTIRVPDPEGKIQPLPELKLNLKDSKLATALEELASLGRDPGVAADGGGPVEISDKPQSPAEVAAPPIASPPAPVPIRVEPVFSAKPIPIEVHDPRQPSPVASMQELSALASLSPPRDLAAEQPIVDVEQPLGRNAEERRFIHAATSRIVIAALIGFLLGFGAGRWGRSPVKNADGPNGKPAVGKAEVISDSGAESHKLVAVRGRITFQTDSGERPDHGARVLLLPEKRGGSTKLPIAGFRATDANNSTDPDRNVAAATLRVLGGDVMTVDDAGNFESVELPAGSYRILALSHFQTREAKSAIKPDDKLLLESYFDKPDQLLGRCSYRLEKFTVSGNRTEQWNHTFERE